MPGAIQGRVLNEAMSRDAEMTAGSRDDLGRLIFIAGGLTDWVPTLISDETVNDSDKSFITPAASQDQVAWIWVEFVTADDQGGVRQIVVELQDNAADVIGRWIPGITQAANTTREYCFAPSNADLTAVRDGTWLMTPIPPTIILPAGFIVRVYDNNAVAAAADDMVVQMMIFRRTV